MAEKIILEIVTPYGTVFSGEVDEVNATGSEGDFGVLAGHAHYLTTLKIGSVYTKVGTTSDSFFVNRGFAEVGPEKMVVLADSAEHAKDIDVERAREARRRAEERLSKAENIDFIRAEAALQRALMRLLLVEGGRR